MTLYLGNIHFSMDEAAICALLAKFGPSEGIRIPKNRQSGVSRGYAFADMADADGRRAIAALDGQQVRGRTIRVKEANPPKTRRADGVGVEVRR